MSYLVLARKYRPQTFEEVVRQDHVTRTLSNAIEAGRIAHAILFTGPRGTGKTTVARILAKAMNCEQGPASKPCNTCRSCLEITNGYAADVFEIDGASNNSVDQVRDLRDNLKYMPAHSRFKIYIIDEVHMLSLAAFNALLKTLEEPPAHVLFMFATTEVHKIPITILSRCQRHDLRRIETSAISEQLRGICDREQVSIDDQSLTLLSQEAGGSMRDALSLLDHVVASAQGPISAPLISQLLGLVERRNLFDISAAVFARDIKSVLEKIDLFWRQGYELKRFYTDLVAHFHHLAVAKLGAQGVGLIDLPSHEIDEMKSQTAEVPASYLTQIFDVLFQAEPSIKLSAQPRLALEMIFLKLFQTPPSLPLEMLIDKLEQLRGQSGGATSGSQTPGSQAPSALEATAEGVAGPQTLANVKDTSEERNESGSPAKSTVSAAAVTESDLCGRVLERLESEKPSLAALLRKCSLSTQDNACFDIEVTENEFVLKSITRQVPVLEEICSAEAGRAIQVKVHTNIEDAGAKEKQKQEGERLKKQALSHPMVMAALEIFNGKVIDIKVIQEV